jgi:putative spermidine/putrescine transport system ATP-binding protein
MSSSGVTVELTELTRVYGTTKALDGLTLHIEPGEMVALLGPSGCGKTTALRILAGLDEATSGTVSVGGVDVSRVPANKRDMGMVFQAYSLFPHLTVLDNVAFGLKMRGKGKQDRLSRASDMLDLVGLAAHKAKYANVRWAAAAGGAGQGAGDPATGAAARRAAVGAGRQGAHPAA